MPSKPEPRVRHISEMPVQITAVDARKGDIWVGESADIVISDVTEGDTMEVHPWDGAADAAPVTVTLVRLHGTITRSTHGDKGYTGVWSVQPDQAMEVLRGR